MREEVKVGVVKGTVLLTPGMPGVRRTVPLTTRPLDNLTTALDSPPDLFF